MNTSYILSLYKKLLRNAKLLENHIEKKKVIDEIRVTFRKNKKETNLEKIQEFIKGFFFLKKKKFIKLVGESKLSFLNIITPKLFSKFILKCYINIYFF